MTASRGPAHPPGLEPVVAGLEVNLGIVRRRGRSALLTSVLGIEPAARLRLLAAKPIAEVLALVSDPQSEGRRAARSASLADI